MDSIAAHLSGLWGPAAPLGPVVAALVPRCALLPAPTPRLRTRFARGSGLASGPKRGSLTRDSAPECRAHDRQLCATHDRLLAQNVGLCASSWPSREARPQRGVGAGRSA